jgi:hypothetical protein
MTSTREVKHSANTAALRKTVKHSHEQKGVLKVKLSCGAEIEKDQFGVSLTKFLDGQYHTGFGTIMRIRSFSVDGRKGQVRKATLSFRFEGYLAYMQSISIADFRAIFHAFKPENVDDELNLLGTSEEEVIATSTDQVPMAGTNNA